jgi:hypothetical protein
LSARTMMNQKNLNSSRRESETNSLTEWIEVLKSCGSNTQCLMSKVVFGGIIKRIYEIFTTFLNNRILAGLKKKELEEKMTKLGECVDNLESHQPGATGE